MEVKVSRLLFKNDLNDLFTPKNYHDIHLKIPPLYYSISRKILVFQKDQIIILIEKVCEFLPTDWAIHMLIYKQMIFLMSLNTLIKVTWFSIWMKDFHLCYGIFFCNFIYVLISMKSTIFFKADTIYMFKTLFYTTFHAFQWIN